jgi:uncharacterized protein
MIRQIALATTAAATFAIAFAAPGFAQTMPTVPERRMTHPMTETDSPLLSFSITEEVKQAPDRASIGAGVTTTAPSAVEAMRANATAMDRVVRALRAKGIAGRDIQTSGINLSPQYDYTPQQQGQPPRLIGYQVSNQVRVTTADIANLGPLLDTLVESGGTNLDGPSFFVADPETLLETARETALRRATERASRYARAAGYRSARLVSLSEGGGFVAPPPMPMMRMESAVGGDATPVQPGQVSNSIMLTLQYRLER